MSTSSSSQCSARPFRVYRRFSTPFQNQFFCHSHIHSQFIFKRVISKMNAANVGICGGPCPVFSGPTHKTLPLLTKFLITRGRGELVQSYFFLRLVSTSIHHTARAGSRPISPLHVNRSDSLEIGVTDLQ